MPARTQHASEAQQGTSRLREMLERRDAEDDVERSIAELIERVGKIALDRRDARIASKIRGQGDVDENGFAHLSQHGPHEAGVVPAAEVADAEAGKALDVAPDGTSGQPDPEPVDGRKASVLTERTRADGFSALGHRAPRGSSPLRAARA